MARARKLAYYVRSLSFVASSWLYVIKHAGGGATFYSRDYAILLLLSIMGLKPIAEIHDYRSKRSKAFIGLILKNARRIIVNSEGTLELLRQHYKLNLDKVLVAPNGVDLDYFNIKLTKDEARRSLGIDSNDIIFGYVGSLEAVGNDKGVGDLIEAFNKISLSMARLLIVGGPDNLVNKYKSMVRSDNIEFAGHVEYGKIPTYLRAIDVVVIPLPNNAHGKTTSPIKVYEFMAAGKAIVASNIDTLKSALSESGAVFYEVGNVEDLRDTVLHLARDEELRHDLEANVLKNLKDISWDGRATKIINHIEHNEISK
ncbi:MAG: Glycosyl transferase group 1 [Candidatus Yanofskybacteria bacterium GW2011_GWF1_44_227]|nr:MAG: Glycosyl transferase group 1 [Candidatus Yanofskybacteria bacterium GW2011_GWF1_44_227]